MTGDRWGPDGPPEEAYSRVTRDLATLYAPVVEAARRLLDELEAGYDVARRSPTAAELDRVEGCDSDAAETTVIEPPGPDQSPLIVCVCDLPGVHLAYGRWVADHLPECGCDACDESAEDLLELLDEARQTAVGGFDEWVRRTGRQWWVGHATRLGSEAESSLDRGERRELGITAPIELTWRPWTPR